MAAASTVLRFVTVRNPRKAGDDDLSQRCVFYDDDAVAAPLVRAARQAWPEGRNAVYLRVHSSVASGSLTSLMETEIKRIASRLSGPYVPPT